MEALMESEPFQVLIHIEMFLKCNIKELELNCDLNSQHNVSKEQFWHCIKDVYMEAHFHQSKRKKWSSDSVPPSCDFSRGMLLLKLVLLPACLVLVSIPASLPASIHRQFRGAPSSDSGQARVNQEGR